MNSGDNHERESQGVVGVWQVREIALQDGSGPIADKSFPNIIIFTRRHYSMMWVFGAKTQRSFAERWNPTNAEKIERFDALVVNSGTYEINGSTLTAHPIVARIPEFVGGTLICEYRLENDTMRLKFVDEYSYDGVQAPWVASGKGLMLTLICVD
ncbi:hypothetical protein AMJ87_08265 [candidate division WOR_3 bacterium SM23_60]|uniref:Lipocalin-like domain-containing protein n=1 Tax=candidate division WOR_3 bacterium SM23_60 TaxID=1703780 RepID=A0A0S8GCU4_UNCW3|nr:MAG: hypothetical protein AMJ87_08265 [candidate division WOR_3 bacterium SM23_60]